jgi:hypothetical protein
MFPIAFHCLGNLVTGNFDTLTYVETRQINEDGVLVVADAFDGDTSNLTLAGSAGIGDVWVNNLILC